MFKKWNKILMIISYEGFKIIYIYMHMFCYSDHKVGFKVLQK